MVGASPSVLDIDGMGHHPHQLDHAHHQLLHQGLMDWARTVTGDFCLSVNWSKKGCLMACFSVIRWLGSNSSSFSSKSNRSRTSSLGELGMYRYRGGGGGEMDIVILVWLSSQIISNKLGNLIMLKHNKQMKM